MTSICVAAGEVLGGVAGRVTGRGRSDHSHITEVTSLTVAGARGAVGTGGHWTEVLPEAAVDGGAAGATDHVVDSDDAEGGDGADHPGVGSDCEDGAGASVATRERRRCKGKRGRPKIQGGRFLPRDAGRSSGWGVTSGGGRQFLVYVTARKVRHAHDAAVGGGGPVHYDCARSLAHDSLGRQALQEQHQL